MARLYAAGRAASIDCAASAACVNCQLTRGRWRGRRLQAGPIDPVLHGSFNAPVACAQPPNRQTPARAATVAVGADKARTPAWALAGTWRAPRIGLLRRAAVRRGSA